uniref:Putative histone h1 n=1 Tax=Culex tarsalis TaxID=7177 RepID=A0A1Q3G085_CULTA
MRKRSMSVFQPRDDNRLSKKFEGVVSDVEAQSDSEEEEDITEAKDEGTIEAWTKADYELLVEKIRTALPKKDVKKAKWTLQHINWDEIQIRQHSTEEVRRVALSLVAKVRTFRTLGEMLNDVPEVVDKILSADKPKAPLSAYSLFMKEYIPSCSNTKDAFRTGSKTFQELSAKKKKKFEDAAAQLKVEYQEKLAQFYETHPDMVPAPKAKKASGTGRPKASSGQLKRERNRTPFNLFYESRMEEEPAITLQQCRQEWEGLGVKDKLPFIRKSFETQDDAKLLNKKEQELLAQFHGKPEFVGRSAYDFFHRKNRSKYEELSGKERKQKLDNEYQQLSERQKLDLKMAFLAARDNYILQYQKYIKELPEDKQKAEIEYLQSISSSGAGKKDKNATNRKDKKPKDDDHYPGSTDEDPPVAESTTIKKAKPKPAKKKPADVPPPVQESDDDEDAAAADENSSYVAKPAMPSPTKKSRMEPPKKPPAPTPEEIKEKARRQLEMLSSASSSAASLKNGRKRQKEEAAVTQEEVAPAEDDTDKKSKKKTKKEEPKVPMKEPERPPTVLEEFYRQRVYKGKVGKHKESFASLSAAKKREIREQMAAAQKVYIDEFEQFLKSLPKDQIRVYIQKVNSKRTSAPAKDDEEDDDDDDEEGSTETGSSGSDEEEEDE